MLEWSTHVSELCFTLKQRLGILARIKTRIKNHDTMKIIAEAICISKIRCAMSVYTKPKYEFNHLEQAMDPNIAKL